MVIMGRVTAPFGIRGWVKVQTLTARSGNLCAYPVWWLKCGEDWKETLVAAAKTQNDRLVARFAGVVDRNVAAALTGCEVAVPRELLPQIRNNEFYWADLIGLKVTNAEHEFGRVAQIVQTGANDVLVVERTNKQTLIPFIAAAIKKVDLAAGVIEVDWGEDFA